AAPVPGQVGLGINGAVRLGWDGGEAANIRARGDDDGTKGRRPQAVRVEVDLDGVGTRAAAVVLIGHHHLAIAADGDPAEVPAGPRRYLRRVERAYLTEAHDRCAGSDHSV